MTQPHFAGYLGYVVTAHYIRTHLSWDRRRRIAVGLPLMLVGAAVIILSFYVQATPLTELVTPELEIGWSFCTLNVFALTTGAFLLFTTIPDGDEPAAVLQLSRLSFIIYLMHIFWLGLWVNLFKTDLTFPTVAAIPTIAVCTFLSCRTTAFVISLLPGARWLGIEPQSGRRAPFKLDVAE